MATGRHLGASGRPLGGILEDWMAMGGSGASWRHQNEKVDRRLQPNAKVLLKCQFHEVFLRVGVTKYCKLQGKMLRGSRHRSDTPAKAPYTTP